MRTMIFIIVVVSFAVITVVKRRSHENAAKTEVSYNNQPVTTGYEDEKISILSFYFKEDQAPHERSEIIERDIETALSKLLCSSHVCRVEFITVGYYLVVVIRAKLDPAKASRKGGIRLWRTQ